MGNNLKAENNSINVSLGAKITVLRTNLQAVFNKNGDDIEVLVAPTDAIANKPMSISEVIEEIKTLMGDKQAEIGNLEEQITTAVQAVDTGVQSGANGFDISKVTFMIRQAFLYYYKKGNTSSGVEYAFSLEISFDGMMDKLDILSLDSISLSLWTTKRSKIIERMGILSTDEFLTKYPIG